MLNLLKLLPIVIGQAFAKQTLGRTPETFGESAVMDEIESVKQYDNAMQSKLAIVYAGALERIHQCRRRTQGGRAIDLCCGPGHFTLLLAKYFDYDEIIGVDLSQPMIDAAKRNAEAWGLAGRVRFEVADATSVPAADRAFDLVTCNDAAHHLPTLEVVAKLLSEMDRLAADDGMVLLTDLVRLKSASITEKYTQLIGKDYIHRGLLQFQQDFCNSMQAAWTGSELSQSIPKQSRKVWSHSVQWLLPAIQFLTCCAKDNRGLRLRKTVPWNTNSHPIPVALRADWEMFRRLI